MFGFCIIIGLIIATLFNFYSNKNTKQINSNKNTYIYASNDAAKEIKKNCTNTTIPSSDRQRCYMKMFYTLAKSDGYEKAIAALFSLQKMDNTTYTSCHFIAHQIGEGVYRHDKNAWRKIIGKTTPVCGDGVLHGIIGEYMLDQPKEKVSDPKIFLGACDNSAPLNCFHAIGHVLYTENLSSIDTAVAGCKVFPKAEQRKNCYKGTFMENVTPVMSLQHGVSKKTALQQLREITKNYCNV